MFCRNCGNKINPNAKFCKSCGTALNNNPKNNFKNTNQMPTACIIAYISFGIVILMHILNIGSIIGLANTSENSLTAVLIVGGLSIPVVYIIGLISAISAKVSNPNNKHATILLIISIVLGLILIVETISFISVVGSCLKEIENCGKLG